MRGRKEKVRKKMNYEYDMNKALKGLGFSIRHQLVVTLLDCWHPGSKKVRQSGSKLQFKNNYSSHTVVLAKINISRFAGALHKITQYQY